MPDILAQIIAHKRSAELPRLPPVDLAALADLPMPKPFRAALRRELGRPINVIAECKKGSPSRGIFVRDYDPVAMAFHYQFGGAAAVSVLTDERFFFGHLDHLVQVVAQTGMPVIRKDFIVDPRQIAQARLAGASAILLIAAGLEDGELRDLQGFARDVSLDVLVEVHDADEALRALNAGADLVGVNNRNLKDFSISLETTFDLLPGLRGGNRVLVSESGIATRADCQRLEAAGVDAVLVGETLMTAGDPSAALRRLRGTLLPG